MYLKKEKEKKIKKKKKKKKLTEPGFEPTTSGLEIHYSTANIKAVRGSLWWLSVNKLSHIPDLQSVSAVYENQ